MNRLPLRASSTYLVNGLVLIGFTSAVTLGQPPAILATVAAAYPLGRVASVFITRALTTRARLFVAISAAMACAAAALALSHHPVAVAAGTFAVSALAVSLFNTARTSLTGSQLVTFGPVSMIGALVGVILATLTRPAIAGWTAAAALATYFVLASPLERATGADDHARWPLNWQATARTVAVALASYGPLTIAPALTAMWVGRGWVPMQQAAYMVGGLAAGWLNRRIPIGPLAIPLCAAVGGTGWALCAYGPSAMIAAMVVVGAVMFVVQGRLEADAAGQRAGAPRASALAAIGVCLAAGSAFSGTGVGALSHEGPLAVASVGLVLAGALTALFWWTRHFVPGCPDLAAEPN